MCQRYIAQLKRKAEHRKREQDIIWERMQQKEVAKEEAEFGHKEKFVTTAYKQKLLEDQKWEAELRRRDAARCFRSAHPSHVHLFGVDPSARTQDRPMPCW